MIRRTTLSLNAATGEKKDAIDNLIVEYLSFLQHVINTLWNHKIFFGKLVPKKWYESIKTSLTERYKQCAAKQALAIVKSQRKREKKGKRFSHYANRLLAPDYNAECNIRDRFITQGVYGPLSENHLDAPSG